MLKSLVPPKMYFFLWRLILFLEANSADPDEMLHNAAFYLGFHCLPNKQ